MDTELLTDEKYEELLRSRDRELTESQRRKLKKIDRAEVLLNEYSEELDDDAIEEVSTVLRRRQMELLTDEKEPSMDKILEELPDQIQIQFNH
ncbi:hypothetical protein IL252_17100 [Halomicrobium sp. IBSBa]|uniref:hypothetical protein n=1 Tax=Halomicrobium sp. IBSBa TaxID=2778916 RepID=UPI001ABF53C7|nr:hypothetical protein [Halomicrobium sp. IBSBa]MBO4249527.1 hypothetical protein [Halomicrobium sp. IBSBa]